MAETDPEILERVRKIVRRDLKLGPDASIPDDMPFFNSDLDLDSLDVLLLVTSIEKEFGLRIPSHAVGKEVFSNLSTLARYVQDNIGQRAVSPAAAATAGNPADYLSRLPHTPPFRFISEVKEVIEGQSACGVWALTGKEDFFAGHFPDRPIVPGVLIAEALAQLSGLAGPITANPDGKLVHVDIRFVNSAAPPAEILLESTFKGATGNLQQFDVRATVGTNLLAQGSLTLYRGG